MIRIPLGNGIEFIIDFLTNTFSVFTKAASALIEVFIDFLVMVMSLPHPWLFIVIAGAFIWFMTNKKIGFFSMLGFIFIYGLNLWPEMISTLALVIVATLVSIVIGVPIGILNALNEKCNKVITPVLDFMQTMPAFVYLIPAIPFFGLGAVSAVFATVIFAVPPSIRLTTLGIRQIPKETIEAADSFGSTKMQKLFKVQLPLALPTILTGVNQTIMLSLSMVVIAAMIGAKGLGGEVWKAIQRLDTGLGFEAGIAVVVIAMILDRFTNNLKVMKK